MTRPLFDEKGFPPRLTRPFLAAAIGSLGSTLGDAIKSAHRLEQFRAKCELVGADPEPMIDRARSRAAESPVNADPFWRFLDDEWRTWHQQESGR